MEVQYHDPTRVACLKNDFAELDAHDQGSLLLEWGVKTYEALKQDWKAVLWGFLKWLAAVILSFIAGAAAVMSLSSCTVTPAQHAQIQAVDTLLHAAAPYVITVQPGKK